MQWGQWKDERKGPFSALFFFFFFFLIEQLVKINIYNFYLLVFICSFS